MIQEWSGGGAVPGDADLAPALPLTEDPKRVLEGALEGLARGAGVEHAALQPALKKALLAACHTRSEDMESHAVLLRAVAHSGLDEARARAILGSEEFAAEVREREAFYTSAGIHSVPAVIINDQHLISGGQPAAVFEQALRQIAAAP